MTRDELIDAIHAQVNKECRRKGLPERPRAIYESQTMNQLTLTWEIICDIESGEIDGSSATDIAAALQRRMRRP